MKEKISRSGVIAYRIGKNREIEILLIRNRGTLRWMIPKGRHEEEMTSRETALMEAWEEAGIKGRIIKGNSLGTYRHPKLRQVVGVKLYLMKVGSEKSKWPEKGKRIRRWFTLSQARKRIYPRKMRKILRKAEEKIRKKEGLMKEFYLIRHGKSSHGGGVSRDFDRPLNKRGLRDSSEMGRRLAAAGIKPDLIMSSTALRASTTAELIADQLNYPREEIRFEKDLYLCAVHEFRDQLSSLDEKTGKVLIVAHNPGIHEAETYFSGVERDNVPTCGICGFEALSWKHIKKDECREIFYDYPKNVIN